MNDFAGTIPTEVFSSTKEIVSANIHERLFGGLLAYIQNTTLPIFVLMLIPAILVLCIYFYGKTKSKFVLILSLAINCLISVLLSMKISQGWDEFYLNLRHSFWLSEGAGFSANAFQKIEATVDFLPFFVIGFLERIGFPPSETGIVISLFGNVLCMAAGFSISKKISKSTAFALTVTALVACFPALAYMGATGFMANLFTGLILWCIHDLFVDRDRHERRGLLIASVLCLFRMEGVLLAGLIWAWIYLLAPILSSSDFSPLKNKRIYLNLLYVMLPFVLLEIWRRFYFGYFVPVPVVFKSSIKSFFYWKMGFRFGVKVLIEHKLQIIALVSGLLLLIAQKRRNEFKNLAYFAGPPLLLLCIFEMPYHLGGGDWFPVQWGRYELPLLLFVYLCFWNLCFQFIKIYRSKDCVAIFVLGVLFLSPIFFDVLMIPPITVMSKEKKGAYSAMLTDLQGSKNGWERIDRLSAFGLFMKNTFPPGQTMASSEMATIFYFSGREILDLLGLVNREVANSPINHFSELSPISRRHLPSVIDRNLPDVLALGDMVSFASNNLETPEKMTTQLRENNLADDKISGVYFMSGTFDRLIRLGYHHMAIFLPNMYFIYWVHDKALAAHEEKLRELGLIQKQKINIPYHLSKTLLEKWPEL